MSVYANMYLSFYKFYKLFPEIFHGHTSCLKSLTSQIYLEKPRTFSNRYAILVLYIISMILYPRRHDSKEDILELDNSLTRSEPREPG